MRHGAGYPVRLKLAATAVLLVAAPAPAAAHHAPGCNSKSCDARVGHKKAKAKKHATVRPHRSRLLRIADCESGRRWHLNTGNGHYGGLQFTLSSFHAVGGRGMPHHATALEQMYRAVRLMHLQGWGAWPVCSRRAA